MRRNKIDIFLFVADVENTSRLSISRLSFLGLAILLDFGEIVLSEWNKRKDGREREGERR